MKYLLSTLLIPLTVPAFSQDTLSVYFDFDQSKVRTADVVSIGELQQQLDRKEIYLRTIESYTDTTGTHAYNNQLSLRRMYAVTRLLRFNTDALQHPLTANGERLPPNQITHYNAERSRRVDIIYGKVPDLKGVVSAIEERTSSSRSLLTPGTTEPLSIKESLMKFITDSTQKEAVVTLSIEFISGTYVLLHPNDPQLYEIYSVLQNNPHFDAEIRGHVCCGDNFVLSHQRANVVYNYLIRKGVLPKRIRYQGYSNREPIVSPEVTEEDRQRNRRVDVRFYRP